MAFHLRSSCYLSKNVALSNKFLPNLLTARSFFTFDGSKSKTDGGKLPEVSSDINERSSIEYLSRQDIVEMVAEDHDLTKAKADRIVKSIFDTISEAVTERKIVRISGFGSFENRHWKSRQGRNPNTGEPLTLDARQRVKFKAYEALKASVNGK